MEINIGKTIKKLRAEKGATQEDLAKYLNITFQSVSKWETGAATPDTALLPQIAVFFGVAIDDLFSIGDTNHFERVDKVLAEADNMSESSFLYAKRYLTGLLDENPENTEALVRLVQLFETRMDNFNLIAAHYAEQAIKIDHENSELHRKYARLRGIDFTNGPVSWRMFRFYDDFVKKNPDNQNALINLHRAYIQTNKYKEAEEILNRITDEKKRALLKADMLIRLGKSAEAFEIIDKCSEDFTDDPVFLQEAAERHDRADHFETALELYEKSFDIMPEPKYLPSLYHRAFMYDRFGYYEEAIKMWEEITIRLKRDWNSEDIKWAEDTIKILSNKITNKNNRSNNINA